MEDKRIKADILVIGDLVCEQKLIGGGKIYSCPPEGIGTRFDTSGACVVEGGLSAAGFDCGGLTVVVTGAVATKGGCHGEQ